MKSKARSANIFLCISIHAINVITVFTVMLSAYWRKLRRVSWDDREQQVINLLIQHRTLLVQIALKLLHTEVRESEEFNRLPGKDKKAA